MNFYPSKNKGKRTLKNQNIKTILLVLVFVFVGNFLFAQKVTIVEKKISLRQIFKKIRTQTGYNFVYPNKLLEEADPVNLNFQSASVAEVLDYCFTDRPFIYTIDNKTVIIKRKIAATKLNTQEPAETARTISGFVTNFNGEPLNGATIVVNRTRLGVTTNKNGIFVLKGSYPGDTLICRYIGYAITKITVTKAETYDVRLKEATNGLDEVVVQAYGQTTRRQATGDIGVLGHAEIEKQPVFNPLMALQGKIAGVVVTPTGSFQDGPVRVEIRGRSSVDNSQSAEPLYIIDGVPLTVLNLRGNYGDALTQVKSPVTRGFDQFGTTPGGGISPLSSLNPRDIESISVLKDADATAIYGSRGANGVVLITTKRGKAGKTALRMDYNQGLNFSVGSLDLLNTSKYLALRKEAFTNDGLVPNATFAPDLMQWDTTRNFDWQKYIYSGHSNNTNINANLSGGDAQSTFSIGGSYADSRSLLTKKGGSSRGTFSASINNRSLDQRFNLSFAASYSAGMNNESSLGATALLAPDAPPIFLSSGKPNFKDWNVGSKKSYYPTDGLLKERNTNTSFLSSNLSLSYNLAKGLTARTNIGYNMEETKSYSNNPISSLDPFASQQLTGDATFSTQNMKNWIVEPQVEYNRLISKGEFNFLIGGTLQANSTSVAQTIGAGYTSDALLYSISNANPLLITASSSSGQYKYTGVFTRIGYNWNQGKYIINFNARRDGSSRFGPGNQFGNFGSVGAAWAASNESWIKNALPQFISFIKFRGSYGITGSDAIGDYAYLAQWGNPNSHLGTYNGISSMTPQIQPNLNYHWQVNKKLEAALDMAFFEDRLDLSAAWYRDRCNNQLIGFPTPIITGFTTVAANSPANVENSGYEISFNANMVRTKDFNFSTSFNIAFNHNKLLAYPDLASSPYKNIYTIGQSLNTRYLIHYTGVDPFTGQYTFEDHNHDGKIIAGYTQPGILNDDAYVAMDLGPKYSGGWSNQFSYKSLRITLNFDFTRQRGIYGFPVSSGNMSNITNYVYDHMWHYSGQKAIFARATTNSQISDSQFSYSDGNYTDASFLRLSTMAISYTVPASFAKKLGLNNLTAQINAQHLLVFSKYLGIDPEIQSFGGMPPQRTITWGINCSL